MVSTHNAWNSEAGSRFLQGGLCHRQASILAFCRVKALIEARRLESVARR